MWKQRLEREIGRVGESLVACVVRMEERRRRCCSELLAEREEAISPRRSCTGNTERLERRRIGTYAGFLAVFAGFAQVFRWCRGIERDFRDLRQSAAITKINCSSFRANRHKNFSFRWILEKLGGEQI
ncbi:uncharacterized protein LOC110107695 isoform X2 [Dendrobium catenatum]|uniref:uncharacterized protein LOC110107695 isoform X2 n=1 Tax=Dendrobium catenatum TaxID=906689 RepID=UPI0009F26DEE|nr:uncharacterized protein LOC110107695 isoform X2 [Dendrobium catenatum]